MNNLLGDWHSLMGAVQHWLAGGDPYGAFVMADGSAYEAGWFAYPPPVLLLVWPLAFVPSLLSGILLQLLAVAGFEYWSRYVIGHMSLPWFVLWLPFVQGLLIGQTTLLALVLLLWGATFYQHGRDRLAGLLLACAILKPQVVTLPALCLLAMALYDRRWYMLGTFAFITIVLWSSIAFVAGPQIYAAWFNGLSAYRAALPDRPLLFPPAGWLLGGMACFLWYRYGRGDPFSLALLVNTLIYPLSVVYIAIGVAPVVMRWRPQMPWYPLVLSWFIPLFFTQLPRTAETIAATSQLVVATALFAAFLPRLHWRLR